MPGRIQSLYVHVPFCAKKCSYCAFYSEASNGEVVNRYVDCLIRELEIIAGDLRPQTVFFGGGTPSILNLQQWQKLLAAMERLDLLGADEWTVECNPATVSLDKAKLLRDYGVNRISMGVQSLDEDLLDRLGRVHSREMVFKSFDLLRAAGFSNLNIDLMFAIPGQTLAVWQKTLHEALALQSEHLSSYEVIYEEDTALYAQLQAGDVAEDEDLACAMYDELLQRAPGAGLQQYEIANFARGGEAKTTRPRGTDKTTRELTVDGSCREQSGFQPQAITALPRFACRHNINYWRGGSFYGVGPSATTYVRGTRSKNVANTTLYCDRLSGCAERPIESHETLSPVARAGEIAAFGLRMPAGWPFTEFQETTGFDLRKEWRRELIELKEKGWGMISEDRFRLTPSGLRFADSAAELFLR